MDKPEDRKPRPSEVQRYVKTFAASEWEELGTALGLADEDDGKLLTEIESRKGGNEGKCFMEVVNVWLRGAGVGPKTWGTLLCCLEEIEMHEAVRSIRENILQSQRSIDKPEAKHEQQPTQTCNQPSEKESIDTPPLEVRGPLLAQGMTQQQGKQQPSQTPTQQPSPQPSGQSQAASPSGIDYSLKVELSKPVRGYQLELAQPGISGENYIICAPTGTGKTLVAGLIISKHLQGRKNLEKKVVFVVPTRPLAEQQSVELQKFIPGAKVVSSIGDDTMTIKDVLPHNDVIVCTTGKLLNEIKDSLVAFSNLGLMVLDECHHARKNAPHARMMERYLEKKKKKGAHDLPQVVGLTASPGAGENPTLDMAKTIDHLISLCALMDATSGIQIVRQNVKELDQCTNKPTFTMKILNRRNPREEFVQHITDEMTRLEKLVDLKSHFCTCKWSQEYETSLQQNKLPLEISPDPGLRNEIRILDLLRCYSRALNVYMDLQDKDAISILSEFTGLPDDERANQSEKQLKKSLGKLIDKLRQLPPVQNPLLQQVEEILCDQFTKNPDSKGILFVRTKKHASSVCDWISALPIATHLHIRPRTITGHTRETGHGMTQDEQQEVMACFHKGGCNLLVATSVAEEGLDVPACNLVIRFQHVSNEIARTQTQGRARAAESEGFTILSSDSKKAYKEIKNDELQAQVDEVLQKYFPTGQFLQQMLSEKQQQIVRERQLRKSLKQQQRKTNTREDIQLRCKKCKAIACSGSDIYTVENATHYVVPDREFTVHKVVKKPHQPPKHITPMMKKVYKIHCVDCDAEWGNICVWPTEGHEFPVLKCKSFIFEISGVARSIKKWSDVPFKVPPLSDQARHSESDSESD